MLVNAIDASASGEATSRRSAVPMLQVRDLVVQFGGVLALDSVSFDVAEGQILALIGPNGAGKTTLFNCISRLCQPDSGNILLRGNSVLDRAAHEIAGMGVSRTFQNLALFDSMTVFENIMLGCHHQGRGGFVGDSLRSRRCREEESRSRAVVAEIVHQLELEAVAYECVAHLPFGTRKRVELARALACAPALMLIDEPAGGLNQAEVEVLGTQLQRWRDERGITVLLVEHHMGLVMPIADTVVVLDFGRRIAVGTAEEIRTNPAVVAAYLGEAEP